MSGFRSSKGRIVTNCILIRQIIIGDLAFAINITIANKLSINLPEMNVTPVVSGYLQRRRNS